MLLDYDRDGDMDVVMTGWDEPVALFRNEISGPDTHWIEILLDTDGVAGPWPPTATAPRSSITTGGVTQYDWINGGATYLGRSQPVAHFGIAGATTVDITVEWADGTDDGADGARGRPDRNDLPGHPGRRGLVSRRRTVPSDADDRELQPNGTGRSTWTTHRPATPRTTRSTTATWPTSAIVRVFGGGLWARSLGGDLVRSRQGWTTGHSS